MRLLNIWTFEVKEFPDHLSEHYVILSHTWEKEEITFQDISKSRLSFPEGFNKDEPWSSQVLPTFPEPVSSMKGFQKLKGFCQKARVEGFDWVWMDTCCIDKSSSAELSEAINSMYTWYETSAVCYVYLSDVQSGEDPCLEESSFRKSRWFTRGWTLQELISPMEVVFFANDWKEIGSRWGLSEVISEITSISERVLKCPSAKDGFSFAQRMSWASARKTTRIEDEAYCLLGIFNINMPLLYGEGPNAFIRLQIEILNSSDDLSLFGWQAPQNPYVTGLDDEYDPKHYHYVHCTGLLAESTKAFCNAGTIAKLQQGWAHNHSSQTRSGIYVQANKQIVEFNGPVFGPIFRTKARPVRSWYDWFSSWRGLTKPLSRDQSTFICSNSNSYHAGVSRSFREYVEAKSTQVQWSDISIAFIGELWKPRQHVSDAYTKRKSFREEVTYVAILLDQRAGGRVNRMHWPPLVTITLREQYFINGQYDLWNFLNYPLTLIHGPIKMGQKERGCAVPIVLLGPKEYSPLPFLDSVYDDQSSADQPDCIKRIYNPAYQTLHSISTG